MAWKKVILPFYRAPSPKGKFNFPDFLPPTTIIASPAYWLVELHFYQEQIHRICERTQKMAEDSKQKMSEIVHTQSYSSTEGLVIRWVREVMDYALDRIPRIIAITDADFESLAATAARIKRYQTIADIAFRAECYGEIMQLESSVDTAHMYGNIIYREIKEKEKAQRPEWDQDSGEKL